ncbi:phosphoribosyltransferase [Protofrankia symbiont of Coriaria ruscifolia]|uniref:Phosphoribosyltransferase n=1 Tax=Candidatus Protofrankia californiensis TaxID=1839754 RepID=A0A1C3NU93_9ACTN|nr:phosphoribosyltransferase [Protofrankia symbiont of Coriaria ruscifolia]SBW18761.1 phosphoribosyltransferase [Candidatus Protofrankia californiensis]
MHALFADRPSAGHALAEYLTGYADRDDVIVLALPRGGVPVAFEVAQRLGVELDVFLVRKLGAPGHAELAMGALAGGGTLVRNDQVIHGLGIEEEMIAQAVDAERRELARREGAYRVSRTAADVTGRVVLLIDDGMATGATMRAAVDAIRRRGPAHMVVAVPVASEQACRQMRLVADGVVCLNTPSTFFSVGQYYADFSQTTDEEVRELLRRAVITK